MNRRGFLKGLAAAGTIAAAPALAREGILMPVKQVVVPKQECNYGRWSERPEQVVQSNVVDYNEAPVHSSYVAGYPDPLWREQFKEAVRQYQRDMIEQSMKLNERILMEDMIAGATPASNSFFNNLSVYGQAVTKFSKEDLAKLKKRYPST